MSDFAIMWYC